MNKEDDVIKEHSNELENSTPELTVEEKSQEGTGEADQNNPENNQSAQGDATESIAKADEPPKLLEIEIDQITHYEPATDFITLTNLPVPYVIITPEGNFALDGHNLIVDAKSHGKKHIYVLSELWPVHSDYKLSRKKFKLRSATTRDTIFYIETIKHIANFRNKHLRERPDLTEFSVGGARKGLDQSSKLNAMLMEDTDLGSETISKYLTDVRYLSDAAIDILREFQKKSAKDVGNYPNKAFFESIRKNKISLAAECESMELKYDEIVIRVSEKVLEAYNKYRKDEPVEAFSEAIKTTEISTKSVVDELLLVIDSLNESNDKKDEQQLGKETLSQTTTTNKDPREDKIQDLAKELWELVEEPKSITEKSDSYNDIINKLLRIVGTIGEA